MINNENVPCSGQDPESGKDQHGTHSDPQGKFLVFFNNKLKIIIKISGIKSINTHYVTVRDVITQALIQMTLRVPS